MALNIIHVIARRANLPRLARRWGGGLLILAAAACSSGLYPVEEKLPYAPAPRAYTPAESLKQFDAAPQEAYRLGAGDQVHVQVWEKPELSGLQVVGPDGAVTVPLVGSIAIAGL